ncbi:MAG TPA: glycosyltransferase family 4 protein [Nitrospiria bacterium]|nr:glycosyltransferase family 4 protein [Nitrospiria bacterium]
MRVCYFGTYERDYPRNRVLIRGLVRAGIDVVECHVPLWEKDRNKTGKFLSPFYLLRFAFRLAFAYVRLLFRYFFSTGRYDLMIVGYLGHIDIFPAFLLTRLTRRPLIFNPLLSLYDTVVGDRGMTASDSLLGRLCWWIDRRACLLSDRVILDTDAQIDYFCRTFDLPREKFSRCFVGAEETYFHPRPTPVGTHPFLVLFYGKLIPLHGIPAILDAAKMLEGEENIHFEIIGEGQLSAVVAEQRKRLGLKNASFTSWVDFGELPSIVASADVCLGIFSDGDKAARVIANKVFQALATGRAVLTRDSPAIHELFPDGDGIFLVPPGDPKAIADAILKIRDDPALARATAAKGWETYQLRASEEVIGRTAKKICEEVRREK